ncbi:dihydroorotate dehydrogenase electron transfer subunit [Gracilinema caldarium]|uniref:Dihydroorotate dehydrogenase, electron transfer subunit, iron-sulfur cluster binding domain protein n=1 Tax=Gracilinema caldarium (strain ATCC 51460 / DSM 7334 / H1) TaxID=744872 RepID=F8EXZ4_GRAC1|nr:dihydroorotate dehydrogenase electron transfer subunit [Gracilinema caldarium]AEJ20655.1 Dihydroorotate dehydrogenase, electron transfer subunit, iron-sulfur cluster binding domain protein [Gracilinema caldarium DSM 7334]
MADSSTCHHDRAFLSCTIVANAPIHTVPGEGLVTEMQVSWEGPVPQPGQFFMLRLERSGVLLGRPISVLGYRNGLVSFMIAERGKGSRELVTARAGEAIELSGPLGNTWPVPPLGDGPIALVGGGIGIAPLIYLSERLPPGSFHFYGGFRSKPYGLEGFPPESLTLASEDGSVGYRGRIPDVFNPAGFRAVYACGPTPMLKRIAEVCGQAPCYISLEERMACGVGACLGCTVRTTRGNRRCCVDGPIFPAAEVLFDA